MRDLPRFLLVRNTQEGVILCTTKFGMSVPAVGAQRLVRLEDIADSKPYIPDSTIVWQNSIPQSKFDQKHPRSNVRWENGSVRRQFKKQC